MSVKTNIKAVVTNDGQRVALKWRRERSGNFTATLDISKLSGIQFDAKYDRPLCDLPPVTLHDDDNGLVCGFEYRAGVNYTLTYDSESYVIAEGNCDAGSAAIELCKFTTVAL